MAKSTVQPKQIEFLRYEGNMSLYKLTKPINKEEFTNDFTGEKLIIYEYEECILEKSTIENLEIDIKDNFEDYWNTAKDQTLKKADLKRKLEKYKEYQKNGELIDMIQLAGTQITDLMIAISMLQP